jgi:hypothetical protein
MQQFSSTILKFAAKGEKTGWTYIEVSEAIAQQLKPGNKKSFRVKGKLDDLPIKQVALIPMGDGSFILPINSGLRKIIKKSKGALLIVQLMADNSPNELNEAFAACLADDPAAQDFFKSLPGSHQNYFSKWIETAKTEPTQTKRIAMAVNALSKKMGYPEMIRWEKSKKA